MPSVAILGASGYAGGELIRLVDAHPEFQADYLAANQQAGRRLREVHPHLSGGDRILGAGVPESVPDVDLVFLALPHGASRHTALALLDRGMQVVDLGSDFRFDDAWAYGLPERNAEAIATSDRVAAPGCYPTSAVLAVAPLLEAGLIEPSVIVNAVSGVSGAGRSMSDALHFGAVDESVRAYKVAEHRHRPEIVRALGGEVAVTFTPHLVPMQRGILTTAYAPALGSQDELREALAKAYAGAPFVEVVDVPPETRWVVGSNRCLLAVYRDDDTGTAIVLSAIDNLLKGAAGQAVQCANLMFGLDQATGLPTEGFMP